MLFAILEGDETKGRKKLETRNKILIGDCREVLATLPEQHFHCCVTSPPYYGLRDYGTANWEGGSPDCDHKPASKNRGNREELPKPPAGWAERSEYETFGDTCPKCGAKRIDSQIGLEDSLEAFISEMVAVFREVWRVLRDDGVLWCNLGDSYASGGKKPAKGLKPKDLCGIPWRVALALQTDGWFLRDAIIWHKPSPMPGSQRDRCTNAYEFIFQLTKKSRYYWDMEAVKEEITDSDRAGSKRTNNGKHTQNSDTNREDSTFNHYYPPTRIPRNVWRIASEGFSEAHFATYPVALPIKCIKAATSEVGCCAECGAPWERIVESERVATRPGTKTKISVPSGWDTKKGSHGTIHREGRSKPEYRETAEVGNRDPQRHTTATTTTGWKPGCECEQNAELNLKTGFVYPIATAPCRVLDPFGGAGTTAIAARELAREYTLIELNPEYAAMAEKRIRKPREVVVKQPASLEGQKTLFDD